MLVAATALLLGLFAAPRDVRGQDQEQPSSPAFSVGSSQIFTSKERAAVYLTFRRVDHLDFRVYRVNDTLEFFGRLRDPHQLGSEEPLVPQERTLIERMAIWKASWRDTIRYYVRGQFSHDYRAARRERSEQQQVQLRRTVSVANFAQVPLLNPSQLITSWRELLPPVRDTESRRIPLDLPGAGTYVVEAVSAPLRAYTVVIVSDVGLVTKTAPGELLLFAANLCTGVPVADCDAEVLSGNKVLSGGRTGADGLFGSSLAVGRNDQAIGIVRCGAETAATDPGAFALQEPARDSGLPARPTSLYARAHRPRQGRAGWQPRGSPRR